MWTDLKKIFLKHSTESRLKICSLQARPCVFHPGNFTVKGFNAKAAPLYIDDFYIPAAVIKDIITIIHS